MYDVNFGNSHNLKQRWELIQLLCSHRIHLKSSETHRFVRLFLFLAFIPINSTRGKTTNRAEGWIYGKIDLVHKTQNTNLVLNFNLQCYALTRFELKQRGILQ